MDAERIYTVEEAEASLPELRVVLDRVRSNRQVILRAAERIRGQVAVDGGGYEGTDYWEATASLKADIEALAERDILLRDPETGLIDFPGERDGRRVYLCWQLGEDHVSHWHDLDSGFGGRKPL
ncbi:MAG TPA: DUF2203 domain-containing protein [Actinomycetota bacterium]|nr:DUF2203 domain-containing protein [Actinomycetota bacterium]